MAFRLTGRHAIILSVVVVLVLAIVIFINYSPNASDLLPSNQTVQFPGNDNIDTETTNTTLNKSDSIPSASNTTVPQYVDPDIGKAFNSGQEITTVLVHTSSQDMTEALIANITPNIGVEILGTIYGDDGFIANITSNGFNWLISRPEVIDIYQNRKAQVTLSESARLIGARDAVWNLSVSGQGHAICILDTGINHSLEQLGGGVNVTVFSGWNFVGFSSNNNTMDDEGHGTHVAGIIASSDATNKGVSPNATLVAVKVCDSSGGCDESDIEEGLRFCINNRITFNISVISISIGLEGTYYDSYCNASLLRDEIDNATNYSIPVIISSGNNGQTNGITWPACTKGAIPVGSVYDASIGSVTLCKNGNCLSNCTDTNTASDQITCETNRGSLLNLLAPGCAIHSLNYSSGLSIVDCGTSQAAPHVSAVAALLLQREPSLTPSQILQILNITGRNISDSVSGNNYSRIDAYKAVSAVQDSLLRVNTLSLVNYSSLSHAFAFTIQNANLSNITNISWSIDLGDGTKINSTYNITQLLWKETALVRLKHNYSQNGIYIVNASTRAGNLFHSKNITVFVGDVILYDLKQINISSRQRMFQFTIRNNKAINLTNLGWNMSFGDGTVVSNSQVLTLDNKTDVFFRINYNYISASPTGGFRVTANATNVTFTDSKNITVDVI